MKNVLLYEYYNSIQMGMWMFNVITWWHFYIQAVCRCGSSVGLGLTWLSCSDSSQPSRAKHTVSLHWGHTQTRSRIVCTTAKESGWNREGREKERVGERKHIPAHHKQWNHWTQHQDVSTVNVLREKALSALNVIKRKFQLKSVLKHLMVLSYTCWDKHPTESLHAEFCRCILQVQRKTQTNACQAELGW